MLPYAAAHNIGMLVYGPLAHGLLTGHLSADTTFPRDWRSRSDMFTCAGHVDAAIAAADPQLDAGTLAATDEIVRSAQDPTGPSADSA